MISRLVLAAVLGLAAGEVRAQISAIATMPEGSTGQLQYNADFLFGGVSGSLVQGSTVTLVEIRATTAAFGAANTKSTFTSTGSLFMASGASITLTGPNGWLKTDSSVTASAFFGAFVGSTTYAERFLSTPTAASSGFLCRGVTVYGWCIPAVVETAGVSAATSPVSAGALYTHENLTGTSAHGAASANTASAIVARDGSGNFAAGTITAALSGNATTASALAANGANCSAGNFPLGTDAAGAVESCTDAATQAELDTHAALTGASAHSATALNTASQIVTRDPNGDFAATQVTLSSAADVTTLSVASGTVMWGSLTVAGNVGAALFLGPLRGNADTSTALAANGANCGAGNSPLGVDASGAVESCFDVGTQTELDTHAALTGSSAHGATSLNTASAIVARDSNGAFVATRINLSGSLTAESSGTFKSLTDPGVYVASRSWTATIQGDTLYVKRIVSTETTATPFVVIDLASGSVKFNGLVDLGSWGGLKWPNGQVSTAPTSNIQDASGSGSSFVGVWSASTTWSSLSTTANTWTCPSGSTMTVTLTALRKVRCSLNALITHGTSGAVSWSQLILDGDNVVPGDGRGSSSHSQFNPNSINMRHNWTVITRVLSSGSHTFCPGFMISGGATLTVSGDDAPPNEEAPSMNCEEVPIN